MPDLTTSTAVDTFMGSANAAAMRTNLGLGTAAMTDSADYATAAQGTDARTPTAHASTHLTGGADAIQSATSTQPGLATAAQISKLNGIEAGADVTDFVNVASVISDTEAITTLADADKVPVVASGVLKNIAYSALKTLLNAIYGLKSATLDQFADVTQTAGKTLSITESTTLAGGSHSGTNTGDNAVNSNYSGLVSNATHIGDATGATELTLATVNPNVGSFGSATAAPAVTVNAKGLVTAVTTNTITPAVGSITGLGTGVATALAVNVGSAGAPVVNGGALGTPSGGTLTNCTGLPVAGITGTLPVANGGTGQTTAVAAFDALAPTTTKGDLIAHNGTDNIRVAVGATNGHVLTVDSAEASGMKWAAAASGGSSEPLFVSKTDTESLNAATWTDIAGLSLSFTAASVTQKILVRACVLAGNPSTATVLFRLVNEDGTLLQGAAAGSRLQAHAFTFLNSTGAVVPATFEVVYTPGTTSARTYKVQWYRQGSATVYINRSVTDTDSATFSRTASTLFLQAF